jgi:phosphate transport system substrate-binding protein
VERIGSNAMKLCFAAAAVTALAFGNSAAGGTVRLHGATTTVDLVISSHRKAVEKKTGLRLEILPNNAGRGLLGLVEGKCDIALTAADLETTKDTAEKSAGPARILDFSNLVFTRLRDDQVVFIVNTSNTVNSLTDAQIKAIYTGRIKNWSEAGGQDIPIVLFSHNTTSATRSIVKAMLFGGDDYSPSTRALIDQRAVVSGVESAAGGFSAISRSYADGKVKILKTSVITRPLGFITRGRPKGDVKKVVDAFVAEMAEK